VNGLLVVDKPSGPTSHDVVYKIRKLSGISKVGHAGTLDPPATGILLIGLGKATRLLGFIQALPKAYAAEIQFGSATSTQDAEGEVLQERSCSFGQEQLEREMASLTGEIDQVPPMVSAVKVGGQPLYKAARKGEEVERAARPVMIYEFTLKNFDPDLYRAQVFVRCSSGTYVRTLAANLGEVLGCGAHLSSLRRVGIGSFEETASTRLDEFESGGRSAIENHLLPPREAMRDFPSVTVDERQSEDVSHGRPLNDATVPTRERELAVIATPRPGDRPAHEAGMTAGVPVAIVNSAGELLAVYRRSRGGLKPEAVLTGT
jgi:tRNA pseudouridine55 synthase